MNFRKIEALSRSEQGSLASIILRKAQRGKTTSLLLKETYPESFYWIKKEQDDIIKAFLDSPLQAALVSHRAPINTLMFKADNDSAYAVLYKNGVGFDPLRFWETAFDMNPWKSWQTPSYRVMQKKWGNGGPFHYMQGGNLITKLKLLLSDEKVQGFDSIKELVELYSPNYSYPLLFERDSHIYQTLHEAIIASDQDNHDRNKVVQLKTIQDNLRRDFLHFIGKNRDKTSQLPMISYLRSEFPDETKSPFDDYLRSIGYELGDKVVEVPSPVLGHRRSLKLFSDNPQLECNLLTAAECSFDYDAGKWVKKLSGLVSDPSSQDYQVVFPQLLQTAVRSLTYQLPRYSQYKHRSKVARGLEALDLLLNYSKLNDNEKFEATKKFLESYQTPNMGEDDLKQSFVILGRDLKSMDEEAINRSKNDPELRIGHIVEGVWKFPVKYSFTNGEKSTPEKLFTHTLDLAKFYEQLNQRDITPRIGSWEELKFYRGVPDYKTQEFDFGHVFRENMDWEIEASNFYAAAGSSDLQIRAFCYGGSKSYFAEKLKEMEKRFGLKEYKPQSQVSNS